MSGNTIMAIHITCGELAAYASYYNYMGTMYVQRVNSQYARLYGSDYNYWQYDGYFFGYYFN